MDNIVDDPAPATPRDWASALTAPGDSAQFPWRVVVAVAHPDDETVALGPLLPRLAHAAFVYATDGAPANLADARAAGFADRTAYARARRAELEQVFEAAGIDVSRARFCNLRDQEAVHALTWLARRMQQVLGETRAELVITHPYEGGHPDHDATAFAVHAARRLLARKGRAAPAIVEAPFYHNQGGRTVHGRFLPPDAGTVRTREVSGKERAFKRRLLACFATQARTLQPFPTDRQSFRPAPDYDFERPPHTGPLLYELHGWGTVDGRRWRRHARAALRALALAPAAAPRASTGDAA